MGGSSLLVLLFHSTETAHIRITKDLQLAADFSLLAILILLHLSAAFDTISHTVLLSKLISIGLSHTPLEWFKSYQSGHTRFTSLNRLLLIRPLLLLVYPRDLSQGPFFSLSTFFLLDTSFVNIIFIFTVMQMIPSSICPPNLIPFFSTLPYPLFS